MISIRDMGLITNSQRLVGWVICLKLNTKWNKIKVLPSIEHLKLISLSLVSHSKFKILLQVIRLIQVRVIIWVGHRNTCSIILSMIGFQNIKELFLPMINNINCNSNQKINHQPLKMKLVPNTTILWVSLSPFKQTLFKTSLKSLQKNTIIWILLKMKKDWNNWETMTWIVLSRFSPVINHSKAQVLRMISSNEWLNWICTSRSMISNQNSMFLSLRCNSSKARRWITKWRWM